MRTRKAAIYGPAGANHYRRNAETVWRTPFAWSICDWKWFSSIAERLCVRRRLAHQFRSERIVERRFYPAFRLFYFRNFRNRKRKNPHRISGKSMVGILEKHKWKKFFRTSILHHPTDQRAFYRNNMYRVRRGASLYSVTLCRLWFRTLGKLVESASGIRFQLSCADP